MLDAVMEHVPEGLTISDAPDGRVRLISRYGAELMGETRESIVQKNFTDYVSSIYHADGETPARVEELPLTRAMRRGEVTKDVEWLVKRPDGGTAAVLSRAAPIRDGKGRITGAVVVWRDITERKRLEDRLRERAKLESLGVLAGGIAHDFNNLLTTVLGHASLLMTDLPEGSKTRENAQEISKAAERAARLSRQMLAFSGHGRLQVESLDLSKYVRGLAPMIESSVRQRVQLKLDLANDLPPIEADVSQIQELISNLVCNGVEAMGPYEGRVTIGTRLLLVDKSSVHEPPLYEEIQPGTYVALEVSDSGSGLDKETAVRMFDPFFSTKFTGRGMGLAAVRGIVRGHKGAILVYSAPGRGTTISALFPVRAPTSSGTEPEPGNIPPAAEGSGMVLMIDDEESAPDHRE
jgi:PAS domain S-box-containing protein